METIAAKAAALEQLRFAVILNKSSGSCDDACADKLLKILEGAQITPVSNAMVEGKDIDAALDEAFARQIDVLIILGGDGTIRAAGEHCVGTETKLIPLPGGTMNMLAKALYGDQTWDVILRQTLSRPKVQGVSAGLVEGHYFFCAGIFGSPALWADAREAARSSQWTRAIEAALTAYHRAFSRKIDFSVKGKSSAEATAISVICPLISAAVPSATPALEVAIMKPKNIGAALHLAWSAAFLDWRKDANVSSEKATEITVSARSAIPAILDGERVTLKSNAAIEFEARAFLAMVPA